MSEIKEKPNIKLPFGNEKTDAGEWAYDHRRGLLTTLVIAVILVLSALYVTISIENTVSLNTILIELEQEAEQIKEPESEPKQVQETDYAQTENLISNLNAQGLNPELSDQKNTPAKQIYDEITQMENKSRANREMYQRGLAEDAAILNNRGTNLDKTIKNDVKIDGSVTVSFSFVNPIRNSANLTVPAYMCQGGGRVVIDAVLNRNGRIVSASVNKASTTSDNCMRETAISAAKSSRFDVNSNAPEQQKGQIIYIFIPQ